MTEKLQRLPLNWPGKGHAYQSGNLMAEVVQVYPQEWDVFPHRDGAQLWVGEFFAGEPTLSKAQADKKAREYVLTGTYNGKPAAEYKACKAPA